MPRPPRWYDYLEPVTAEVPCGGATHRVTWRRGKLVLEDHDLGAELAMLALGGQASPCVQVLKMWRDQWGMLPEMLRRTDWLGERAYLMPPALEHPRRIAGYRNWERTWRRASFITKHGSLLDADLTDLATEPLRQLAAAAKSPAARTALGRRSITLTLSTHGQGSTISGSAGPGGIDITARLGVPWLVWVWARGAAFVDGAFVVEVLEDGWSESLVRAARWGKETPAGRRLVVSRARLARGSGGVHTLAWAGEEEAVPEAEPEPPPPRSIFDMDVSELFGRGRAPG